MDLGGGRWGSFETADLARWDRLPRWPQAAELADDVDLGLRAGTPRRTAAELGSKDRAGVPGAARRIEAPDLADDVDLGPRPDRLEGPTAGPRTAAELGSQDRAGVR